jgi:hypothetical protein
VNGPSVIIMLGIERRPRVYIDADNDVEERRLLLWLVSAGYWGRLVELALEIAEERRAA